MVAKAAAAAARANGGKVPHVTTAAVDRITGKIWVGSSGNPGVYVPESLRRVLPSRSLQDWPVTNCGEVAACAAAVRDGAALNNLIVISIRTADDMLKTPCGNCRVWVPR
jgi:hypothetical protein